MKKLKFLFIFIFIFSFLYGSVFASIGISPLKYELQINSGDSLIKKIKITNGGDSPITLYTSTEDFISGDSSGKPKFLKPNEQDSPELSLANWVDVGEKNVTLIAGETREVDFKITVPKNGEPGGHYGAIFFSPGIANDGAIIYSKRIGVLLLIEVLGETVIDGNLENFLIGEKIENELTEDEFIEKNNFNKLPITFNLNFRNNGNIHLKPTGKIELIDEDGNILKNIGKEIISTPTGTYVGEKMVDYIPINDFKGNVLPNSNRLFEPKWEGFGYTILNEDGTKTVNFKSIEDYYIDKASEKQEYLMFWEQLHTKKVKKKIIVDYKFSYESKDKEKKEFNNKGEFFVEFNQKYIGLNYYIIIGISIFVLILIYFLLIHLPKNKKKKEEEIRKKIINEMKIKK